MEGKHLCGEVQLSIDIDDMTNKKYILRNNYMTS